MGRLLFRVKGAGGQIRLNLVFVLYTDMKFYNLQNLMIMKNLFVLILIGLLLCNNQKLNAQTCNDPNAHNFGEEGSCETCFDFIKNGDEIGVDCGGSNPSCPPCDFERRLDVVGHARVFGDLEVQRDISVNESQPRGNARVQINRGSANADQAIVSFGNNTEYFWHMGLLYDGGSINSNFHISRAPQIRDGSGSLVNTPELTIGVNGEVGIGTRSPTSRLHVQTPGSGNATIARFQYGTGLYGGTDLPYSVIEFIEFGSYADYSFRPNFNGCLSDGANVRYLLGTLNQPWSNIFTEYLSEAQCGTLLLADKYSPINDAVRRIVALEPFEVPDPENEEGRKIYGVNIEKLERSFPDLITKDGQGNIGIRFTRFAPIFIQAFKEQQAQLEEKEQRINQLEARLAKIEALVYDETNNQQLNQQSTALTVAKLLPNEPNPFSEKTLIRYYIPERSTKAEIIITNLSGKMIKTVPIQLNGEGQLTIHANSLIAGIYLYSLIVDGKLIATEKMILTGLN